MKQLERVLWNIIVAGAYLATGRLGLLLALENGYASPIWPPAGVALAAVLLRKHSVWPGLFLGAFLTNSNLGALFTDPLAQLRGHPENLVIAAGNSLQPLVGAWLLRRFANFPNDLCATSDILRFYLYAGPIACCTAATVGTLTLTVAHTILPASMPATFLVWWVGDTNGVLILTPIIVSLRFLRKSPRRYLTLATALSLAFALTIVSSFQIRNWEHQKLKSLLVNHVDAAHQAIESRLTHCLGTLDSLATFLQLTEPCSRTQFETFAASELSHSDSVFALSWNPLVEGSARATFERRLFQAYQGNDQIIERSGERTVPAPIASRYVPVLYIFPLQGNAAALGFNVWSDPLRREALALAASEGKTEATAGIRLVQTGDTGTLLFKPIYRAKKLLGFATAVVRLSHLMERSLAQAQAQGLYFRLTDISGSVPEDLAIYQLTELAEKKMLRLDLRNATQFRIGSRVWSLESTASDKFVALHQDKSAWLLLLTGCLLTGVLGILILTVSGRELLTKRAIEERTRELTKANQAKSDFLANMSHEIRTPMNGIIAMADLLAKTKTTSEQREYVEIVRTSGAALLVIINDILDFSKIEAGKLILENIPLDLYRVVEEVGELMSETAHEKGLELAVIVDHKLPRGLIGDPGRLRQVLLNLVSNAIKFTETGSVALEVQLDETYPRFLRLTFLVRDTGIGISIENQRNLFHPFFQGDSSMTRKFGGTGLGLAICKQLVEKMGGTISMESHPGGGSCFRLKIPLQKDAISLDHDAKPRWAEPPRILVVDQLSDNRRALIELLLGFDIEAEETGDPQVAKTMAARRAAENRPYQIIIHESSLDLGHWPGKTPKIITGPLVMRDPDRRRLFLAKPVKTQALREAIDQALGQRFEDRPQQPAVVPANGDFVTPPFTDARILLVEDNRTNQKVATFMLKKLGFTCHIAENGLEALAAMAAEVYDLILMDCQMPELDGFDTTRRIRSESGRNQQVTIVAMTANALKGDRERCLEVGMNDYLAKPVKSDDLEHVLRKFGLMR